MAVCRAERIPGLGEAVGDQGGERLSFPTTLNGTPNLQRSPTFPADIVATVWLDLLPEISVQSIRRFVIPFVV
jgi:hypothetical protein